MNAPNIPVKTESGRLELSRRQHGLSQRHRTVLLLVDGARPLSMVLSLAQKAGASVQHFEELVRLDLIALPAMPTLETANEGDSLFDTSSGSHFDSTSGSHAELDLDIAAAEMAALAPTEPMPLEEPAPPAPVASPPPRAARSRTPARSPAAPTAPVVVAEASAPAAVPAPPGDVQPLLLDSVAEPLPAMDTMPVIEVDLAPPPLEQRRPELRSTRLAGEDMVIEEVRELLLAAIDTLPPKHRLHKRLAKAGSSDELVDVIEMVERLVRRHGGASANGKLMSDMLFARELLGLGNTRFIETDFEATRPR